METTFSLFELPGELRNGIYEYVAADDRPFCIKTEEEPLDNRFFVVGSGLILANHQVAYEYYAILQQTALGRGIKIVAQVHNFEFDHVICFLRFSLRGERKLARMNRKLIIELSISDLGHANSRPSLANWRDFCAGINISIGYGFHYGAFHRYQDIAVCGEVGVFNWTRDVARHWRQLTEEMGDATGTAMHEAWRRWTRLYIRHNCEAFCKGVEHPDEAVVMPVYAV
jgi:hypothetical protein